MITRTLAGHVITPAGVGVIKGAVRITPVMPVPADSSGILVPTSATYQINDGVVVGTIVAPATYNFEVFAGDALVWRFTRSVAAVASDITLQDIYLSAVELPTIAPAVVREGDNITRLGSGTEAAGRVPAANGAGGIIWSNAGAGDMTTAVYDPDDDGKVTAAAAADAVPWSGVTGKPSTFPPSAHATSHASGGGDPVTPAAIGAAAASHEHAAGDVTSGQLAPARGGTGVDSSGWTGVPKVTSGTWASGAAAADVGALPVTAGIVSVTSSRNIASTDAGKVLECSGTLTLTGDGTLPAGTQLVVSNVGTGTVTLAATTLRSRGGRNKLSQQWALATMYHRGSGEWVVGGDLTT